MKKSKTLFLIMNELYQIARLTTLDPIFFIIYVVYEWSLSRLSFLMFSTVIEDAWFSSKIIWQVLLALLRSEL